MSDRNYAVGLEGVVAGATAISTLEQGLQYRGYPIEDLATHAAFEEVAFLVLYGELPTKQQLEDFRRRLFEASDVDSRIIDTLRAIPRRAPMMDVMRSGTSLLAHWDPDAGDNQPEANLRKAERVIAQLPAVMAARHRLIQGKEPVRLRDHHSHVANILYVLFGKEPSAEQVTALNTSLILYMEHEFNASAFAARTVCSTLSDLHSSITAALGTLKGPLHGGANQHVMRVLEQIEDPALAADWVREALARKQRIMGFGHRVYRAGDPRAAVLKTVCRRLAAGSIARTWEETADAVEEAVRNQKGLYPNVDWPSARVYLYLRMPEQLFTPLFAVSRVVGWSAHVAEQLSNNRLIRPRSKYIGPPLRRWVPIDQRPAPGS